jgi:hypothetical protein
MLEIFYQVQLSNLFAIEMHWCFTSWHIVALSFSDHGHNSNALVSFVQHVKLLFEAKNSVVCVVGSRCQIVINASNFNPTKSTKLWN